MLFPDVHAASQNQQSPNSVKYKLLLNKLEAQIANLGSDSIEYGPQPCAFTMITMSTMGGSTSHIVAASEIEPRSGNILCEGRTMNFKGVTERCK